MKTKKTISVILALIMLLSCSPLLLGTAFAEGTIITFDESGTFEADDLRSGYNYVIPSGVTMTVPEGLELNIPLNSVLKVEEGGKLIVNGLIRVSGSATAFGTLTVDGIIVHGENVSVGMYGLAQALVRFPSLVSAGLADCIDVWYATSTSGNAYENLTPDFTYINVNEDGANVYLPLNQYFYVKADIIKDGDYANIKYDDALMNVYLNGVDIPYAAESHRTRLVSAGDITYSKWTTDDDFLKTYRVSLPTGTGYTVYGRDGEEGTAYVKWGLPFTFYVEIDDNYQKSGSTAEVYIYNGYGVVNYDVDTSGTTLASTPDASGYYTIPHVVNDYTVYVSMLSIDDPTVDTIGSILQTVRSVFEMIINFFRQIANIFNIGG